MLLRARPALAACFILGSIAVAASCGDDSAGTDPPVDENGCPLGFLLCGELCADPRSSDHCGSCDNDCRGDQTCFDGACACPEDFSECNGECVRLDRDPENCGVCGEVCPYFADCHAGVCEPFCETCGEDDCVFLDSDHEHCGACAAPCADDEVCQSGSCRSTCSTGNECDGACVDLEIDPRHCGACGNACRVGDEEYCLDGECYDACEGDGGLRCGEEQDCKLVWIDDSNCGDCGVVCGSEETCYGGNCVPRCFVGDAYFCDGVCVDADDENCGGCGQQCPGGTTCEILNGVGACTSPCDFAPDLTACDGSCVDTDSDPEHCGDCDTSCGASETCEDGECACTGGEVCDDGCVDLETDEDNCGACDFPCEAGQACIGGECTCPDGETSCSGVCKSLDTDEADCGGCNVICPATLSCVHGACAQELTCEQNFTQPTGCNVFPVQADECGTPVLAETTSWAGSNISTNQFFVPGSAWARDELIRISGETDAPDACCGGGVVNLGFRTAEERLQTGTQFISPNNGVSHATTSIEELGSAFECSQPRDAFFGATGNFNFQVERFAMSGDFNGGGLALADAVPLAVNGDDEVCAQVCGVHKAQCAGEQRQYYVATIPPHRALAIDYGARGNGTVESLEVYQPTGEFVCNAVAPVSAPPGYAFWGARISNHTDLPREVVLTPTAIFASSFFNIAVGLEDDFIP